MNDLTHRRAAPQELVVHVEDGIEGPRSGTSGCRIGEGRIFL